jgi:hypothetical protein
LKIRGKVSEIAEEVGFVTEEIKLEDLIAQLRTKIGELSELVGAIQDALSRKVELEEKPATPAQLSYIETLGYKPKRQLTKREASLIIDVCKELKKAKK